METAVLGWVLALGSGFLLAGGTFFLARKSGLQPAQAALIDTLKDNADAMEKQVARLEKEVAVQRDRRVLLERKVARLQAMIVELADENSSLRQKVGMPPRIHVIEAPGPDLDEPGAD